jgi:hypothetical protein
MKNGIISFLLIILVSLRRKKSECVALLLNVIMRSCKERLGSMGENEREECERLRSFLEDGGY